MLAEAGLTKEKIGMEIITRIKRIDEDRATQDCVGTVLLESLKAALDAERAKSFSSQNALKDVSMWVVRKHGAYFYIMVSVSYVILELIQHL